MGELLIVVHKGFLGLHSARGIDVRWVRESSITMVTHRPNPNPTVQMGVFPPDPSTAGSLVTIGDSGWSVEVMDEPEAILEAIKEAQAQE